MGLDNHLNLIIESLTEAKADAQRVDKGQYAAGTRLRKAAQLAIAELKAVRKEVLEARG